MGRRSRGEHEFTWRGRSSTAVAPSMSLLGGGGAALGGGGAALGGEEQHGSSVTHPDVNSRIDLLFNGRAGGNFKEKNNLEEEEEQECIISII